MVPSPPKVAMRSALTWRREGEGEGEGGRVASGVEGGREDSRREMLEGSVISDMEG